MIEFLPPRDGAFGESDTADFVGFDGADDTAFGDEPPRSRWLTALAVIGVTGLLAGGVIAAAPWDADEVSTPPTTVPAPTTSTPRATTTVTPEPTLPPGYDADPPGMLLSGPSSFQFAWGQSDQGFGSVGDAIEVWMTPEATRTSGRWIVIDSREQMSGYEFLRRDGVRIDAGGRRALMSVSTDGVVEVEVSATAGPGFVITSFGLELAQLTSLAATISMEAGVIDHGDLLGPGGPFEGLERRVADNVDWYPGGGGVGVPDAWSSFVDPASPAWAQVTVGRPTPTDRVLNDLVATAPIDIATLDPDERAALATLAGRVDDPDTLVVGTDGRETAFHIVRFALPDGERLVTVTSTADLDDVLELSALLEVAEPTAWREALIETTNGPAVEYVTDPPTLIGGSFSLGWRAEVDPTWGLSISGDDHFVSSAFDPVNGPTITAYRSIEHAYLAITNTWPNDGLRVVVDQPGLESQEADLRQIGDTPRYAVAVPIDGDLPVTVSWFDLDGTPVEGPVAP